MEAAKGKYYVYMEEERSLLFSTLEELMSDLRQAQKGIMDTFSKNAFTVFSKNMVIVNMGSDGRITLSKEMMNKAGIVKNDKRVICAGVNNKVEIWSVKRYKEQIKEREIEFKAQKELFENEVFKFNLPDREETQGSGTGDGSDT